MNKTENENLKKVEELIKNTGDKYKVQIKSACRPYNYETISGGYIRGVGVDKSVLRVYLIDKKQPETFNFINIKDVEVDKKEDNAIIYLIYKDNTRTRIVLN